jgi:uncharacterized membrane protein
MGSGLPQKVHDNIQAIAQLQGQSASGADPHQRRLDAIAERLSRPPTFYVLFVVIAVWIAGNAIALAVTGNAVDGPPFFWLQGAIALYAALVSTLVLIRQARQTREDERRAHLELHVNLLAEQKATKIIALLEELRRDLPNVRDREDEVANELQVEVDPQLVDSALDGS